MKPILLKIMGINSFTKIQTIDFLQLTSRGLFGIFGPTGSGKSSILDAVTLALYDRLARANTGFINAEEGQAYLYFEFEIQRGAQADRYVVERSYKLTQDGGYKTVDVRLSLKAEQQCVIADKGRSVNEAIENIIGLSYEDFCRSVVLPQGKFSDFLMLRGRERRDMLERIFHLERYGKGFAAALAARRGACKEALTAVQSKLEVYGEVSAQALEEKKQALQQAKKEFEELSQQQVQERQVLDAMRQIKLLTAELAQSDALLQSLDERGEEAKRRNWKIENADRARTVRPLIMAKKDTLKKLDISGTDLEIRKTAYEQRKAEAQSKKAELVVAQEEKERRQPILIHKTESLKQAVVLQEETQALVSETERLQTRLENGKNKLAQLEVDMEQEKNDREALQAQILSKEEEIKQLFVESSYLAQIKDASVCEKEWNDKSNVSKELNNRLTVFKEKFKKAEQNEKELLEAMGNAVEQEKECNAQCKSLQESMPKKETELLELQDKCHACQRKQQELEEAQNKLSEIKTQAKMHLEKIEKLMVQKEVLESDIASKEVQYEQLQQTMEHWRNQNMAACLAKLLEECAPCPVCGSQHHPKKAEEFISDAAQGLEEQKEQKEQAEQAMTKAKQALKEMEMELASLQTVKKAKEEEQKALEEKLGENGLLLAQEEAKQAQESFAACKEAVQDLQSQTKKTEQRLNEIKEAKNSVSTQLAALQENIKNARQRMLDAQAEQESNQRQLQSLSVLLSEYRHKFQLPDGFQNEIASIEQKEEQRLKAEQILSDAKRKKRLFENQKEILSEKRNVYLQAIQTLEARIAERKGYIEGHKQKIAAISEQKDPALCLEEVRKELEKISHNERDALSVFDASQRQLLQEEERYIQAKKQLELLQELLLEQDTALQTSLKENGFLSAEEAACGFLSESELKWLKAVSQEYQEKLAAAKETNRRILEQLAGRSVEDSVLLQKEHQWKQMEEDRNEAARLKAVLEQEAVVMEEALANVTAFMKEEKKRKAEYDDLVELTRVTEGKKFVEYLAAEQLSYITKEASVRLHQITRGRYALDIVEGEFMIADNHNGGRQREAATLSGGEVFLVSFSLALALSSKVQMKNAAPLEFFFLDEGFGTLDNSLIDLIMTSLERLHDEHLHVGLITHVEEMKERIPVRLMVKEAVGGIHGTEVSIEMM